MTRAIWKTCAYCFAIGALATVLAIVLLLRVVM